MSGRKELRLKHYDYSKRGYYFVTICIKKRAPIFGDVMEGRVKLSEAGKVARRCWEEIPDHFGDMEIDEFIVMPDHVHGLLQIESGDENKKGEDNGARNTQTIPVVIGNYKASVTREINEIKPDSNFEWQRSYYEHVIRDEEELREAREYIKQNPFSWQLDRKNSKGLYR